MANNPGNAAAGSLGSAAARASDDLPKGASEIGASLNAASGDIANDLRQLKEDLARLTETVASIAASRGGQAASRFTDSVRSVTDSVAATANDAYEATSEIASSARTHATSFASDVEETVRRNPLGTVLAALGLGMLVGMISRRH